MLPVAVLYFLLLIIILYEGRHDTPKFFSLPRSQIDALRILFHGLEVFIVSWFFAGPIILGYSAHIAYLLTLSLCVLLRFVAAL